MKTTFVSCFCTQDPLSGNPAAIIENYEGTDKEKQNLATQLNYPVTVFTEIIDHLFLFRFFYPSKEMPLCVHGALSAAYVLMNKNRLAQLHAIRGGNQHLIIQKLNDTVQLKINTGKTSPDIFPKNDLSRMLGTEYSSIRHEFLPTCVATVGSPKLLVSLQNYATMTTLTPDFGFIKKWSIDHNINGLYVYTDDVSSTEVDFIARGFNPKGGNNEDAATGVAAGALYMALNYPDDRTIRIKQGEFLNKPSCIIVSKVNNDLLIGGKVRIDGHP